MDDNNLNTPNSSNKPSTDRMSSFAIAGLMVILVAGLIIVVQTESSTIRVLGIVIELVALTIISVLIGMQAANKRV